VLSGMPQPLILRNIATASKLMRQRLVPPFSMLALDRRGFFVTRSSLYGDLLAISFFVSLCLSFLCFGIVTLLTVIKPYLCPRYRRHTPPPPFFLSHPVIGFVSNDPTTANLPLLSIPLSNGRSRAQHACCVSEGIEFLITP
jgi:hypothetical protein